MKHPIFEVVSPHSDSQLGYPRQARPTLDRILLTPAWLTIRLSDYTHARNSIQHTMTNALRSLRNATMR